MESFIKHIRSVHARINAILSLKEPMIPLIKFKEAKFSNCKNCPSCDIEFKPHCDIGSRRGKKIKHHCHVTGQLISALCEN